MIEFKYNDNTYSIQIQHTRKGFIFKKDKYYICIYDNNSINSDYKIPVVRTKINYNDYIFKTWQTTKRPCNKIRELEFKASLKEILNYDDEKFKKSIIEFGQRLLKERLEIRNINDYKLKRIEEI